MFLYEQVSEFNDQILGVVVSTGLSSWFQRKLALYCIDRLHVGCPRSDGGIVSYFVFDRKGWTRKEKFP